MIPDSINRRVFWRYINKKINRFVHHYHVASIIDILFEEIVKDLKSGKPIKIFNFGILELKNTKPRLYHDVVRKEMVLSKGYRILRFKLTPPLRKKLCEYLDIDKTLRNDYE
jgi:nucleoid DNA-binding protein